MPPGSAKNPVRGAFRLFYICQRADRDALAAGSCGVHMEIIQHLLVVAILQVLAGQVAAFEPAGQGVHRAGIQAEPAAVAESRVVFRANRAVAIDPYTGRSVIWSGRLQLGRGQQ